MRRGPAVCAIFLFYSKSSATRLDRLHLGLTLLATCNPREKANLTELTQWGIKLQVRKEKT